VLEGNHIIFEYSFFTAIDICLTLEEYLKDREEPLVGLDHVQVKATL